MAKAPAFQFYPKDWLSSLKVLMMTPAEEGAYIRLLAYCWDSGDCSIPDDDGHLAAMSRLGEGWLKGGSTVVRKCFIPHPAKPGFLTNKRMLEEAAKQDAWKQKSSEGGRKSAAQRAVKNISLKGGSTVVQPKRNRTVQPKGNSSSASASARDSGTTVPSSTPSPLPDWLPIEQWEAFKKFRKKINHPMTEEALPLAINELDKLRAEGHDPGAVLNQSIFRGWRGLFAIKDDTNQKGNHHENTSRHNSDGNKPNKSERARAAIFESAVELGYAR